MEDDFEKAEQLLDANLEEAAVLDVRHVITGVLEAALGDFEERREDLERALDDRRLAMGSHAARVGWEAKDALRQARRRLQKDAADAVRRAVCRLDGATPDTLPALAAELTREQARLREFIGGDRSDAEETLAIEAREAMARAETKVAQLAVLAVKEGIQRLLLSSSPEMLESNKVKLDHVVSAHREQLGSQAEQLALDAAQAKRQAQQRVEEILELRAEQQREAAMLQQRVADAAVQVSNADGEVCRASELVQASPALIGGVCDGAPGPGQGAAATTDPAAAMRASDAVEAAIGAAGVALRSAMLGIQTCVARLGPPPPPEAPAASATHRAHKTELDRLQARVADATTALEKLVAPAVAIRKKAKRRVAFTERQQRHLELFARYDADQDQRLSRVEVEDLARREYRIDVREELWSQIVSFLCPLWPDLGLGVSHDKFGRLLQKLAIERSEVRARIARAEELERREKELEELERRRQEAAQRAARARALCESADALLLEAASGVSAAHQAASPLLRGESLASKEMSSAASSIESALERPREALGTVRTQLDDIASMCEGLSAAETPDVSKLRSRLESEEARIKSLQSSAVAAREKAAVRAEEEDKSDKKRKAFTKLAQRYEELDGGDSDDEF